MGSMYRFGPKYLEETSSIGTSACPLLQSRDRQRRDEVDLLHDLLGPVPEEWEQQDLNRPCHVLEEVGDELAGEPVQEERLRVGHHHVEETELDESALLVETLPRLVKMELPSAQVVDHWTTILKVVGSNPTDSQDIFVSSNWTKYLWLISCNANKTLILPKLPRWVIMVVLTAQAVDDWTTILKVVGYRPTDCQFFSFSLKLKQT